MDTLTIILIIIVIILVFKLCVTPGGMTTTGGFNLSGKRNPWVVMWADSDACLIEVLGSDKGIIKVSFYNWDDVSPYDSAFGKLNNFYGVRTDDVTVYNACSRLMNNGQSECNITFAGQNVKVVIRRC